MDNLDGDESNIGATMTDQPMTEKLACKTFVKRETCEESRAIIHTRINKIEKNLAVASNNIKILTQWKRDEDKAREAERREIKRHNLVITTAIVSIAEIITIAGMIFLG